MPARAVKPGALPAVFRRLLWRRLAGLLPLCLLLVMAGAAHGATKVYKGDLIPGNYEPPIPIVLEMDASMGPITGTATASIPLPTEAQITSGKKISDFCDITLQFQNQFRANLRGSCSSQHFAGQYRLYRADDSMQKGFFDLSRDKPAAGAGEKKKPVVDSHPVVPVDCIRRNTACLMACPRGDYDAEFLCANACRRKEIACKKSAAATAAAQSAPPEPEPED